jgi:hypothetical protein
VLSSERPIIQNVGVYISPKFGQKNVLHTPEVSEIKIITPNIDLRKPYPTKKPKIIKPSETDTIKLKRKLKLQERLRNRKSTPRPSILLLNTLGEGKMIELDMEALKSISKQRRRESRLSIKNAQRVIAEIAE